MPHVKGDFRNLRVVPKKKVPAKKKLPIMNSRYVMGDFEKGVYDDETMGFSFKLPKIKISNPLKDLTKLVGKTVGTVTKVVAAPVKIITKAAAPVLPSFVNKAVASSIKTVEKVATKPLDIPTAAFKTATKAVNDTYKATTTVAKQADKVTGGVTTKVYQGTTSVAKTVAKTTANIATETIQHPGNMLKTTLMAPIAIVGGVVSNPGQFLKNTLHDPTSLIKNPAAALDGKTQREGRELVKQAEKMAKANAAAAAAGQFEEGAYYEVDGKTMIFKNGQLVPYDPEVQYTYEEGKIYEMNGSYVKYMNGKLVPYDPASDSIQYQAGQFYEENGQLNYYTGNQMVPYSSNEGDLLFNDQGQPVISPDGDIARSGEQLPPEIAEQVSATPPAAAQDPIVVSKKSKKGLFAIAALVGGGLWYANS